jgi:hypothetical protein
MSNYSETDFCETEQGLDYIFGRMSAIYGAAFLRHWEGVDHELIRQEWANQLGRFLTYRPSMDFAIAHLNEEFVPSAIKFRNLCNQGPTIPRKPVDSFLLERKMTIHEQIESDRIKAEALEKLATLRKHYGGRK